MRHGIINGVLGVWLMLSGMEASLHTKANYIIPGVIIICLALFVHKAWQKTFMLVIGLWLVAAVLNPTLMNPDNLLAVGAIAALFGVSTEFEAPRRKQLRF